MLLELYVTVITYVIRDRTIKVVNSRMGTMMKYLFLEYKLSKGEKKFL